MNFPDFAKRKTRRKKYDELTQSMVNFGSIHQDDIESQMPALKIMIEKAVQYYKRSNDEKIN